MGRSAKPSDRSGPALAFVCTHYRDDAWRDIRSPVAELMAGIGEAARANGGSVSTFRVDESEGTRQIEEIIKAEQTDGVVIRTANNTPPEYIDLLEAASLPYAVVKRTIAGRAINCVTADDVRGARLAVEHIIQLGHRRIAFICGKPELAMVQDRFKGYREALELAGIPFEESLTRVESSFTDQAGYQAVGSLLQSRQPPTALFIGSDTMAIGGYRALAEIGFQIPENMTVVGYDDLVPAAHLSPGLTTVSTSHIEIGRLAAKLVIDLIQGTKTAPARVVMVPWLVVRASTARPRIASRR